MKVPVKWLKQYVDINVSTEEFASRMIMAGFEVEGIEQPGEEISGVVVGKITALEKHPNADRLQICTIEVGEERPLQIVTGATNVFVGALIPVARIGAKLHGGLQIKHSKLRGVESEGMLCSGEELGIGDDWYPGAEVDGILIFREEYAPGVDVKPLLGMDEPVIDFKITANRAADCMSIQGIAREASVVLGTALREPLVQYSVCADKTGDYLAVSVLATDLCQRYMARVVKDVKIAPSPLWMRQALAAAGIRAINNIVDITNYVMLETGQPMHAFDYRFIRSKQICVRRAAAGEKLLTLDEKERVLNEKNLIIADGEGPVALAGIMGGEHSGIYDETTMVVFESANFNWSSVRLTSRAQGMRTESSSRYEKNLPVYLTQYALDRAMTLIAELGAGQVAADAIDCNAADLTARTLVVDANRIRALLGQPIATDTMVDLLKRLGFSVTVAGESLTLGIPPWRQDIETYADIAEEVQRLHGYDKIPSVPPPGEALQGSRTHRQTDTLKLRALLAGEGFNEALNYTFIAPSALDALNLPADDARRQAVRLINPIGEEYSLLRTTLAPSMLRSLANNLNKKAVDVRLFELSRTFQMNAAATTRNTDGSYSLSSPCVEKETLCIGIADKAADFYDVKGAVDALLDRFGVAGVQYAAAQVSYYHPGRCAAATVDGRQLAVLGEVHPDVAAAFDIDQRVYLAELDVEALFALEKKDSAIKPLPKYPAMSRDLAVTVDKACPVGSLLGAIRTAGGALLEGVELFDIYEGKQVGEGKKSVAFAMSFRAADHTLVDEETNRCFDAIVGALTTSFGAEMRK